MVEQSADIKLTENAENSSDITAHHKPVTGGLLAVLGADVTVSSCCNGCNQINVWRSIGVSKERIIINVISEERFCQNEDTDSPDSQQR